jgi:DNA-binding transcriptional MocR family regulator
MVQLAGGDLKLRRGGETPLYRQLRDQIARQIENRKLPEGTRLPPTRDLAVALGVNRATVAAAYEALVADGLVRSHVGQGTTVIGRPEPRRSSAARWPSSFSRAMEAVERLEREFAPQSDHPDPIDFASLFPDEDLFPVEPFRKVMDLVLRRQGKELLQYGPVAGYAPLREYIAARLAVRGVKVSPADVLIVNGSQQGLDLIFRALLDPADAVAVESPTYSAVLPVLAHYQAQVVSVPMTVRGLDLGALESVLARRPVKLIYTMPTFHNPTGISLDLSAREALLRLAVRYQVPIVEDDFEFDLRFAGKGTPPLMALDEAGLVLYLGTFSKGLFPGLRLGWVVAPAAVTRVLGRAKMLADYHTSLLLQASVLEFCRRGHYDAHLRGLARLGRKKGQRLLEAMGRHFPPGTTWTYPEGGHAFWITLPEGLRAERLLAEAEREGVLFTPGATFFSGSGGERSLRLSISRVPLERIDEGVARLAAIIKRHLAAQPSRVTAHEPAFHI